MVQRANGSGILKATGVLMILGGVLVMFFSILANSRTFSVCGLKLPSNISGKPITTFSHLCSSIKAMILSQSFRTPTLSNVIRWIKSHYNNKISKHAMLLIDDESDYASINTKEEDDPTTINKELRALLELFEKSFP